MSPIVLTIVVVLSIGVGIALDRAALRFLRPPRRHSTRSPIDMGLDGEEVVIDGDVELRMWLMEPDEGRDSVVLLVHGWGANSDRPLGLAPTLVEAGHAVAAVDVRGHGRSPDGDFVTLRHFRDDVARTARALRERYPAASLTVVGHSMGGAAGLLVAADGGPIDRLVTVAAPYDVYDATRRHLERKKLPAAPLISAFRFLWRRRVGVPYDSVHPGLRARDVQVPTLVVQPERDRQVPVEQGTLLARQLGLEPEIVEGAGHSDVLDRPEVHDRIRRFLEGQVPVDPAV